MSRFFRSPYNNTPLSSTVNNNAEPSPSSSPESLGLVVRAEARVSPYLELEFSKRDYLIQRQEYRKQFLFRYFREQLESIFDNLRKNALNGKKCGVELEFAVPDLMDIDGLEQVLKEYFSYLDYTCIPSPRKEDHDNIIRLTLC